MTENADTILLRYQRIREDAWYFLQTCVYTLDQVDKINPIKPFPAELDYLYLLVRILERYPRIAVPKSRRMTVSWTLIGFFLWDTMFHQGRLMGMVSKKEDDSDELIERAKFIYDHIPNAVIPRELLPKAVKTYCSLDFPEINSTFAGYPQGADQLRQFTFSRVFFDEMAFMDRAEEAYSSSMPTLEGGGQMVGVSSRAPGFFKRLVHDELDQVEGLAEDKIRMREGSKPSFVDMQGSPDRFPMEGVEVWINPKNKFLVFQLHYSANPLKRSESYRKAVESSMTRTAYLMEYEYSWDAFSGMPVYPDFDENFHGSKKLIQPEIGLPLLRGWDFGLTPACVVAQLQGDQLVILAEWTSTNMGIKRFAEIALNGCKQMFPEWADEKLDWRDFADPSGVARKDTDEGTCFKILGGPKDDGGFGLSVQGGAIDWEARRSSVEHFLLKRARNGPGLLIDMARTPQITSGFRGGYQYPEKTAEVQAVKVRPIKNKYSHPHDALQMITSKIVVKPKARTSKFRVPGYGSHQQEVKVEVPSI